ncbi:MAG: DUF6249 domain-containing protein [Bacteroidales bacterium]|jgi:hypothetical protein
MDSATIIGLLIAFIAVVGGTGIAIWLILMRHIGRKEERLAKIEARNKERLALIDKGMDPNLADHVPERAPSNRLFLIGLILVFAGLGRIIAAISMFHSNTDNGTLIYILPAFFVGFGFLAYHFYQKRISSGKNK